MLYKKYHRNFVRQFKKRTKFRDKYSPCEKDIVEIEPRISKDNDIKILGKYNRVWVEVVFYNGKIDDYIKVIEDVIQEIS